MHKAKHILLALSLFTSSSNVIADEPYKPDLISEVDTYLAYVAPVKVRDFSFNVSVSFEVSEASYDRIPLELLYSKKYIKSSVIESVNNLTVFNQKIGLKGPLCASITDLDIFVLTEDTMFYSNLFDKYLSRSRPGHDTVYAFYDSTPESPNSATIIISNTNYRDNFFYLQHELAHYWWDSLCIGARYRGSTESYASYFEEYLRSTM